MELKDRDEIAELFKEQLSSHKVNVDPSVWKGVASSLNTATAVTSSGGFLAKMGLLSKVAIAAVTVVGIGVASYFVLTPISSPKITKQTVTSPTINTTEEDNTDSAVPREEINALKDHKVLTEDLVTDNSLNEKSEPVFEKAHLELDSLKNSNLKEVKETPIFDKNSIENQKIQPTISKNDNLLDSDNQSITNPINENFSLNAETVDDNFVPKLEIEVDKKDNQLYSFEVKTTEYKDLIWEFDADTYFKGNVVEYYFTEPGEHTVIVSGYFKDELFTEEISVTVEIEGMFTRLPNVFTPNNDGDNDYFYIGSEGLVEFQLTVFDNEHQLVYQTTSPDFSWNGVNQRTGQLVLHGRYYYTIAAKDAQGNTINTYQLLEIISK